jgi:nucleoside 2-deoxyribosyltransferase
LPNKKRLYFAGPLFTQAEWLWNQQLAKRLEELGFEVVLPQRRAEAMLYGKEPFDPNTLFRENVFEIERADMVLAVLDQADADSGTSWECGYAYKCKRPIIGLRTDIRKSGDDPLGVNLMLAQACAYFLTVPFNKRDDLPWVASELAAILSKV